MATITTTRRTRPAVTSKRVQPVRPERSSFPAGVEGTRRYREAETAYEAALWSYAAEVGAPDFDGDLAALEAHFASDAPAPDADLPKLEAAGAVSLVPALDAVVAEASGVLDPGDASGADGANGATDRKPRRAKKATPKAEAPAPKKAAAKSQPKAKEQPAKKAPAKASAKASAKKATGAKAPSVPVPDGFKSWMDAKLATAVVRMKTKEKKTIKEIASALGLPAEHRSWFAVSKVWRETADAKGLDRPRLSAEAIEARKASRAK